MDQKIEEMMKNPDWPVGAQLGCYEITRKTDQVTKDGYALFEGKCIHCGIVSIQKLNSFVSLKTDKCCHTYTIGDVTVKRVHWRNRRLRRIFYDMLRRCYSESNDDFRWYGANGIKVCYTWLQNPLSFETWALSNGYKENLTIDRIDQSGDYCPSNCRWITAEENVRWKSTTNRIPVVLSGKQWAVVIGRSPNFVNKMMKKHGLTHVQKELKKNLLNR